MQVTICGGGNSVHVAAGYIASKGYKVNVPTTKPSLWSNLVTITTATSSWSHPRRRSRSCSYPVERVREIASVMESLFDIPCSNLPNFLSVTLTPYNQIIHPATYVSIFRDYDGNCSYTRDELDIDPLSAELLAKLDNELQTIKLSLSSA
jgi:hypothetical protein